MSSTERGREGRGRHDDDPPPPNRQAATNAPPPSSNVVSGVPRRVAETSELEFGSFVSGEIGLSTKRRESSVSEASGQKLAVAMTLPPTSSKHIGLPCRPGYGTIGRTCRVLVNHFLVEVGDKDLYQYDVTITPEVPKVINRAVIGQLVKLYKESNLSNKTPAYDGMSSIFTAGPLPFVSKEFAVELGEKDGRKSATWQKNRFKVEIKFATKISMYPLQEFLQGKQRDAVQDTIRALGIILRHLRFIDIRGSFFDKSFEEPTKPGDGFEYWRGFFPSIRTTQMGLSLNIDVSARGFYKPIEVTNFIVKYCVEDIMSPLSAEDLIKVTTVLKGIKVEVNYGELTRIYKVIGITNQMTKNLKFNMVEDGTETFVVKYYLDRYNKSLQYDWLPCIIAGSEKRPLYLPMELCWIVERQQFSKKLNVKQISNLFKENCVRPVVRQERIKKMAAKDHFSDEFVSDEFGIKFSNKMTTVEARVLPTPALQYPGSTCNPQMRKWGMIKTKLYNAGTVQNWACVSFSRLQKTEVQVFCQTLTDMCRHKGMVVAARPVIPLISVDARQIETTLHYIHKQCREKEILLQLLLIVLPEMSGSYGTIKRVCETELGIVSQCCKPKTALKMIKEPLYLENMAMKINVKVGGQNVVLVDALNRTIPIVSVEPTIIFGADVTHHESSTPSIAAVVASMNWPEVTKYRGLISYQDHGKEIIQDLEEMIRDHLQAFTLSTQMTPKKIIYFRDGVGESQFSQVLRCEIDAIRKACVSPQTSKMPPITFVVVQKRHHTRFFPLDAEMEDKSGNVLAGTVVDQKICHPIEFDFYLNSNHGFKGTSRPIHYYVLLDENNFSADDLQSLTNNLCYTYARGTKSLSIVPPVHYAHLLASRARYYVEGFSGSDPPKIQNNVQNVMFYC